MIHYPITIIDNFFNDLDYIVSISKNITWYRDSEYRWPGERSKPISELDPEFHKYLLLKYFLLFYSSYDLHYKFMAKGVSYFQRIPEGLDIGWIHSDYPTIHTIIIYLTPNADPASGTAFFNPRTGYVDDSLQYEKTLYYKGELDKEVARKSSEKHKSQFIQTASCGNIYNRCVGFDGQLWHEAINLNTVQQERLTLITFIEELVISGSPLSNSRSLPFIRPMQSGN